MSLSVSIVKTKAVENKARTLARNFASERLVQYGLEMDPSLLAGPFDEPAPIKQLCPNSMDSMDAILVEACFDETLDCIGLNLDCLCDLGFENYIAAFIRGWVKGCFDRNPQDAYCDDDSHPESTDFVLALASEG